ncbi:hypothetical protein P9853_08925 [Geobacillus stearothermophilus]|nr:hypothetical protein [Geobacillus stearothermophilus]MED3747055.1 hypothetical protein [Geobacillus stearothermophilus]MED3754383.1 hypothetical protein [Geobacillus stearothermophilus]MED3778171.1 hypothetical protein [Geobacillus stearothermophilus]MED4359216.1 hypothetical protein [Geobacillus stearothermophilus]MED4880582.1 hypothetical protein [Geobacillus stearothermophilus]
MIAELRIADEKMAAMVLRLQRRRMRSRRSSSAAQRFRRFTMRSLLCNDAAIAFLAIFKANGSLGRSPMSEAARRFTFAG